MLGGTYIPPRHFIMECTMFKIEIKDVQAIRSATMIIEENTIVEFTGDNSNGKSVVAKVIQALTSGDIRHKDVRRTLINDESEEGIVVFTHKQESLGIIMREESKDSIIAYTPDISDNTTGIFRAMDDPEGCDALVRQFGFRVYAGGDICLQLSPTWGAIPFITTSGSINDAIVQDITVDKIADEFLKTFQTITFPLFKDKIKSLKHEKEIYESALNNMESYDWRAYEDIGNRMRETYNIISKLSFLELEDIPIPNLEILPVSEIDLKTLPIIEFYDYVPGITPIEKELDDLLQILNGVCPTCNKPLV